MKKIKNNRVINLKNKSEYEKAIEMGKISKQINEIYEKTKK